VVVGTCASWDSIWAITAFRYEAPACQNVSITIPIVPELDALDALVVEL